MTIGDIHITVVRKRVRYLRLRVKPDGSVWMSVPWLMPLQRAEDFAFERYDWIVRTRERIMKAPSRGPYPVSEEQKERLIGFLTGRVEYWRLKMCEEPIQWRVKNMKSQWGNCRHRQRLLTFNLQLALVPDTLVDYVIVHELAHLKVQNHSLAFHLRVAEFIPDEKTRSRELRKAYTTM